MKFIFYLVIIIFLCGCISTGLPTPREFASIQGGKLSIVLLRIICEWKDGTPANPYHMANLTEMINVGIGSFLVGGKVEPVQHRYLSRVARKQGWMYLILEPGTHHFVFSTLKTGPLYRPRFKVNIPMNNQIVYAGTLYIYCRGGWKDILGEKYCGDLNASRMDVLNEEGAVVELANDYLSDFESPQTILMQRIY